MTTLFIVNDPPYGTERAYNALRLAGRDEVEVRTFLIGDAAACARAGQQVPNGYYNVERMLKTVVAKGGEVGVCGTCMNARGIRDEDLLEGADRSTMDELTDWTVEAEKVLTF